MTSPTKLTSHLLIVVALVMGLPGLALAIPGTLTSEGMNRDATIELEVLARAIEVDSRSYCSVSIEITDDELAITEGDEVTIEVLEDDLLPFTDDPIWTTTFSVTSAEAAAARVSRSFNCSAAFDSDDNDGDVEMYATAHVDKLSCGTFCNDPDPTTENIVLPVAFDDPAEEDDALGDAVNMQLGLEIDRICRDQDWYAVELTAPSDVTLEAIHRPGSGPLNIALLDGGSNVIANGTDGPDGQLIQVDDLASGVYYFRVEPRQSGDYNFYDAFLGIDPLDVECIPNEMQTQDCGNCGSRSRTCESDSTWGSWSACGGEGVCAPGSQMMSPCGTCGTLLATCTGECQWMAGSCDDGGECTVDAEETVACGDTGMQTRTCLDPGCWSDFGDCLDPDCNDGDSRPCWEGSEETRSEGLCEDGVQMCASGVWSSCQNQQLPAAELCDGDDNDCDGSTDESVCSDDGAVGDACASNDDCAAGLDCITADDQPQYRGGYCSVVGCSDDDECEDANGQNFCRSVFGDTVCLRACGNQGDCRTDYLCTEVEGQEVCLPGCLTDDQCEDDATPVCDTQTGRCVAPDDLNNGNNGTNNGNNGTNNGNNGTNNGNNGTNNGNNGDPDAGTPDGGTSNPGGGGADDEGCCTTVTSSARPSPLALLGATLAVGLAILRRRRW